MAYKTEQIAAALSTAAEQMRQGSDLRDAAWRVGVHPATLDRWRNRFGPDADSTAISRIKRLEAENARLRAALLDSDGPATC